MFEILLATTKSGLPSPSKSPIATAYGKEPVVKSTFAANEPATILPVLLILRYTETVFEPLLAIAKSGLPSPSISPIAIEKGLVPVAKSTFAAKSPVPILVFVGLKMGINLLALLPIKAVPVLSTLI